MRLPLIAMVLVLPLTAELHYFTLHCWVTNKTSSQAQTWTQAPWGGKSNTARHSLLYVQSRCHHSGFAPAEELVLIQCQGGEAEPLSAALLLAAEHPPC